MDYRDEWRERVREISARRSKGWWWYNGGIHGVTVIMVRDLYTATQVQILDLAVSAREH